MALLLLVLIPFPLGFLLRNRTSALIAYIAIENFVFTFQSTGLLLDWGGGDDAAFGKPFPDHVLGDYFSYGVINAVIFAAGLGLVVLGHRVGSRRRARASSVELVES